MAANPVHAQPPPSAAETPGPATVRLGFFSPSVVLGVAAATGALARAGLSVEEIEVASSPQQFSLLLGGALDAALTSPDNVMAYRRPAANPLGRAVDVRILAAVDRGLGLSLFAGPRVDPAAGLRGAVLGVDAPASGFAVAAYELLERQGLRRHDDYEVEQLGTTPVRAAALAAGRCAMTMLNAGSDLRAEEAGCTRVSRACSVGPYVGTVLAALGHAVERDGSPLRRLTSVLVDTCRELSTGMSEPLISGHSALRETAAAVARARLGLGPEGTARYLATLADPAEGLVPDGRLDPGSLRTLTYLRSRHADADRADRAPHGADEGLIDDRFLGADG
jgi:ABC-type nitrate/sulfonate/bicarbonate transport system substrate-binding protein